jgi:hypothetical protein
MGMAVNYVQCFWHSHTVFAIARSVKHDLRRPAADGRQWSSVVACGRQKHVSGRQRYVSGRQKSASGRHRSPVQKRKFSRKSFINNYLATDFTDYTDEKK